MNLLSRTLSAAALLGGLLLPAISRADSVTVALTPDTQTVAPGSTVTFSGTITAASTNGAPIYINGGDINFYGPQDVNPDSTDLAVDYLDALNPGDSVTGDFFTLATTLADTPGLYEGNLVVDGGPDFTSADPIGSSDFYVNIAATSSVTPEPASYLLLASGLLGVAALARRRRSVSL